MSDIVEVGGTRSARGCGIVIHDGLRATTAGGPRRRLYQPIVEKVRRDVFQGTLEVGDRLPSEKALAEQFGVSRAAVREALRVLEMQGLVEVRHGHNGGAFISEPGADGVSGAINTSLRQGRVSLRELYEARRLFEPILARQALERDPDGLARALREHISATERYAAAGHKPFSMNVAFHAVFARVSGNRVMALFMQALLELLEQREQEEPADPHISHDALADHRQILDAVESRDGALVHALVVTHVTRMEARFLASTRNGSAAESHA